MSKTEKQKIKLNKVDDKTAYVNLLVKYAELEQKLEQTEKDLADYQFNYPKIKELEKENAELKEKIEVLECDNYNANCNLNLITDQLTKAKELLTKWVELFKPKLEGYSITPIQEQTEQFLKEIEK